MARSTTQPVGTFSITAARKVGSQISCTLASDQGATEKSAQASPRGWIGFLKGEQSVTSLDGVEFRIAHVSDAATLRNYIDSHHHRLAKQLPT